MPTNNPKHSRKDQIQKVIRKRTEPPNTSRKLRRDQRIRADAVGHERRRGAAQVAAALQFLLQQALNCWGLQRPDRGEIRAGLQGVEPEFQSDDERHDGADDDEVAVDLEPGASRGHEERGERGEEGDEDNDGIGDRSCAEYFSQSVVLSTTRK